MKSRNVWWDLDLVTLFEKSPVFRNFSDRQAPYGMVEELIEKLLSKHQEEDDECLSEPSSCPSGATLTIVFIFPIGPATNLMLRAPNILCKITYDSWQFSNFYQIYKMFTHILSNCKDNPQLQPKQKWLTCHTMNFCCRLIQVFP